MRYSLLLLFILFQAFAGEWEVFKKNFVKPEGNIVDPYNCYRTTSEGQGYGMLLAVLNNDKKAFDRIWMWTKKNLKNKEGFFSWHWNGGKVVDSNNALDADLFITYSLLLAWKKWHLNSYLNEFKTLEKNLEKFILPICYLNKKDYILLPAYYGFLKEKSLTITLFPSYYVPFIFKDFAIFTKNPIWNELYNYTYNIYTLRDLTTNLYYSLLEKKLKKGKFVDLDAYRVILYSYIDSPEKLKSLKDSFYSVNRFFIKNGYIPLRYEYNKQTQTKKESPYCVYRWFYLLYKNKRYLERYNKLKAVDKKNYFCEALDILYENFERGM